jgi:hypothetical protein
MSRPHRIDAQDYTDIQNLYAYYNLCSDAGDADGYASCFTSDGEMSIPELDMQIKGRDHLHAFKLQDNAQRGGRYRRHWNSGLYLEALDGQCPHCKSVRLPGQRQAERETLARSA